MPEFEQHLMKSKRYVMVFSSLVYLFVFLPIVLAGYYLLDRKFKNVFLLIASLLFYAWGEPKFVFIMMASIMINYLFALGIDRFRKKNNLCKILLVCMISTNVAIFFVFKYLGFAVRNINVLFDQSLTVPNIALPIGISFFTFQAISYVIDIYRGKGEVQKNPLNVGLYIAFFPQLIAGPIVRYETVAREIKNRKETWDDFCQGIERFVVGLGKKVLLSNQFAILSDYVFKNVEDERITVMMCWIGAISYTLQIYFDFSGYSDMAIGLGRMFGFHFNENFNYPYCAKSVNDFWRRWHISLSSWFRDYVYIPLGGSRVSVPRHIFNLFVVWCLTGLWHGANWTFVLWGLMYFVVLVFEKYTGIPEKIKNVCFRCIYRVVTLVIVILGWVLFNSPNIHTAFTHIKKMFGISAAGLMDGRTRFILTDNLVLFVIAVVCSTPLLVMIYNRLKETRMGYVAVLGKYILYLMIFVLSVCSLTTSSYNPFIYFNF